MKRVISLMLVLALALIVFSFAAFAEPNDDPKGDESAPKITDQFVDAVREWYKKDDIQASDIVILHSAKLSDDRYILKLITLADTNFNFPTAQRSFGKYSINTSMPVPAYFGENKFYNIVTAYYDGLISDKELDDLLGLEWLGLTKSDYLYIDRLAEKKAELLGPPACYNIEEYEELYYHHDKDGEIDWALVRERIGNNLGPLSVSHVFNNRVLLIISDIERSTFGLDIYDAKEDKFVPICSENWDGLTDNTQYDGITEALEELARQKYNNNVSLYLVGDVDNDCKVTVIDATWIQRRLASMDYPSHYNEIYDYNQDGSRSVLDATAIQKHLASLT